MAWKRRSSSLLFLAGALIAAGPSQAIAQGDAAEKKMESPRAQARFPQAVQVGVLPGRRLIEPEESQHVLGRVKGVVQAKDGSNQLVIETGGPLSWIGIGTRLVLVKTDDCALLGEYVVLADVDPSDFHHLPTYQTGSLPVVQPNTIIRMGIVKPFH